MGGTDYALMDLAVPIKDESFFTVFFETDERMRRLLRHHLVNAQAHLSDVVDSEGILGSALAITETDVLLPFLHHFKHIESILFTNGSPCVGFAKPKVDPQGTHDKSSRLIACIPSTLAILKHHLPENVAIFFFAENVTMAHEPHLRECRDLITKTMGVTPETIDSKLFSAADRERLFWTNIRIDPISPIQVDAASFLKEGWRPLWEFPDRRPRPDLRFGTFTRGFDSGFPFEVPERFKDYPRLSLHSYHDKLLAYKPSASKALLDALQEKVRTSVRIKTSDVQKLEGKSMLLRAELASWIHREGGHEVLRPIDSCEREDIMGYPPGSSYLPEDQNDPAGFCLASTRATGNAFSIPVVKHVLSRYARFVHGDIDLQAASKDGWLRPNLPDCENFELNLKSMQPPQTSLGGRPR